MQILNGYELLSVTVCMATYFSLSLCTYFCFKQENFQCCFMVKLHSGIGLLSVIARQRYICVEVYLDRGVQKISCLLKEKTIHQEGLAVPSTQGSPSQSRDSQLL